MKAVAKADFLDLKENVVRKGGVPFVVSAERFEEINSKLEGWLTEVEEEAPKKRSPRARKTEQ